MWGSRSAGKERQYQGKRSIKMLWSKTKNDPNLINIMTHRMPLVWKTCYFLCSKLGKVGLGSREPQDEGGGGWRSCKVRSFRCYKMRYILVVTTNLADYSNALIAYAATNKVVRFERGGVEGNALTIVLWCGGRNHHGRWMQWELWQDGGGGCIMQCRILRLRAVTLKCVRILRPTAVSIKCVSCTMARP